MFKLARYFVLGPKRGTTNRKTSQSEREKQQQVRAPIDEDNEPEISNDEGGQDEPFLEGKYRYQPKCLKWQFKCTMYIKTE